MTRNTTIFVGMMAMIATHANAQCENHVFESHPYVACHFHPVENDIRLFLNTDDGAPFRHFGPLRRTVKAEGETLRFAMNAGMYHKDRSPVGLYIENAHEAKRANTNDGPGNFHLKPNGVFWVKNDVAGVAETRAFLDGDSDVQFATQSGPMLVIDGALHPRFLENSDSLKRRNGVGVKENGEVVFVISDAVVNFHEFARFFRDEMETPNALFLDGTISRLHAPGLNRSDPGAAMGPIIGVVAPGAE